MDLGEKIYELRTKKGLSQEQLANLLNVSRQSVSKWETSSSIPELDKLKALCDLFNISMDELTLRSNETNQPSKEMENLIKIYGNEKEQAELFLHEEYRKIQSNENNYADYNNEQQSENDTFDELSEDNIAADENEYSDGFFNNEKTKINKTKKAKAVIISAVSILLCVCIVLVGLFFPNLTKEIKNLWYELNGGKIEYTNVLVHGLGGWGQGSEMNTFADYWGSSNNNIIEYLNSQGYKTVAPSVGPISSTWDRACELYAILTGTTVDYGQIHSERHSHERFGRKYTEPLVKNWGERQNGGQTVKINLIGHSFGGATIRLLTHLLEYGCAEEKEATGKNTSPLFTGKKGSWVHSVTTLCAPHNGSSLTEILNKFGNIANIDSLTNLIAYGFFSLANETDENSIYDFQLDHFGLGGKINNKKQIPDVIQALINEGVDHAAYELSPDGAAELNKKIKTVKNVYYYSYSYSTTKQGNILDVQVPLISTTPILSPFALSMGAFEGTTEGGIIIDSSWRENDGLVSVPSAKYPFGSEWIDYSPDKAQKGIWIVMPTKTGDHRTITNPNETTKTLWLDLVKRLDSIR